ncbi:Galactoside O-acetyltransferase [invertebrate metagenome]|uniref:Galactoside O-acetyltransferase n=1 Tax=invertebrate metagenome TaxID=1711999 RepID=A0A2H9TCE3_9ZZZZ
MDMGNHQSKWSIENSVSRHKKWLVSFAHAVYRLELPFVRPVHSCLYWVHCFIRESIAQMLRIIYWTPLFKSRLSNTPANLYLYSGLPLLIGPLSIYAGDNCRISGATTFAGRRSGNRKPQLKIGNNVGISWQNEILVGDRIEIGDNVRLAVKVRLVGYPGHPLEPNARAQGRADMENQVGSIILEKNVWLGAGVTVTAGVRIGEGTVVATGSVVTHDLPSGVLAGGMPARVIRPLDKEKQAPGE